MLAALRAIMPMAGLGRLALRDGGELMSVVNVMDPRSNSHKDTSCRSPNCGKSTNAQSPSGKHALHAQQSSSTGCTVL